MKIRIFKRLVDGVFSVRVHTEAWSERDRELMVKFGEPEINLGGTFCYDPDGSSGSSSPSCVTFPDVYVRVLSESPFVRKFDSRDFGSVDAACGVAQSWSTGMENRLRLAIAALRAKDDAFTTETITEY